jgi:hypothetical protein
VKFRSYSLLCLIVIVGASGDAQNRSWQVGKLSKTEHVEVRQGRTDTATIDGYLNDNRNSFSPNNTATDTASRDYENYQEYAIDAGPQTYVVREHLHIWSKPALTAVGESVKFVVEGDVLYLLSADGKQHKTTIVSVNYKTPALAGGTTVAQKTLQQLRTAQNL